MRAILEKRTRTSLGALSASTVAPSATARKHGGWAFDATGKAHVDTGAVSAAFKHQGIAFSSLGAMYVVDGAPGAGHVVREGLAISSTGQLHVNTGAAGAINYSGYSVVATRLHIDTS